MMNARTHKRGAKPDFTLPKPNPNPGRMTDALWWLVCMRETLEPSDTENGGTYANKPGYHNAGENLPDHGEGDAKTDHSIRHAQDRTGLWWKTKTSAHDWTFLSAQRGDYTNIGKYTKRLITAMKDPADPRPDDVYAYTLGQIDNDRVVEGYSEYKDDAEFSGDLTHLWHRHDSLRRNIIGVFAKMWQALTIDMGWTVAEWRQSIGEDTFMGFINNQTEFNAAMTAWASTAAGQNAIHLAWRSGKVQAYLDNGDPDGDAQIGIASAITYAYKYPQTLAKVVVGQIATRDATLSTAISSIASNLSQLASNEDSRYVVATNELDAIAAKLNTLPADVVAALPNA